MSAVPIMVFGVPALLGLSLSLLTAFGRPGGSFAQGLWLGIILGAAAALWLEANGLAPRLL